MSNEPIYRNGLAYHPPLDDAMQVQGVAEDDPIPGANESELSDAQVNAQIDAVLAATNE